MSKIDSKDGSVVKVGETLGSVSENVNEIKRPDEIKKIQPSNLKKNEQPSEKDNVIELDVKKEQKELDIFESKNSMENIEEEPLVLTEEVKNNKKEVELPKDNPTLSPAVRKMVNEKNCLLYTSPSPRD